MQLRKRQSLLDITPEPPNKNNNNFSSSFKIQVAKEIYKNGLTRSYLIYRKFPVKYTLGENQNYFRIASIFSNISCGWIFIEKNKLSIFKHIENAVNYIRCGISFRFPSLSTAQMPDQAVILSTYNGVCTAEYIIKHTVYVYCWKTLKDQRYCNKTKTIVLNKINVIRIQHPYLIFLFKILHCLKIIYSFNLFSYEIQCILFIFVWNVFNPLNKSV